jgi:hypothetical protein
LIVDKILFNYSYVIVFNLLFIFYFQIPQTSYFCTIFNPKYYPESFEDYEKKKIIKWLFSFFGYGGDFNIVKNTWNHVHNKFWQFKDDNKESVISKILHSVT